MLAPHSLRALHSISLTRETSRKALAMPDVRFFNNGVELREIRLTPTSSDASTLPDPFETKARESLARYRRERSRRDGGFRTPSPQERIVHVRRAASAYPNIEHFRAISRVAARPEPPLARRHQPNFPPRMDRLAHARRQPMQAWASPATPVIWEPVNYYRPRRGGGGISATEYARAHASLFRPM